LPAPIEGALPGDGEAPLSDDELYYAEWARAANTRRGYRSDLADFAAWCHHHGHQPLPAQPATVSTYVIWLAHHQAKVNPSNALTSHNRRSRCSEAFSC
jgi:site-specific recombinase XerD